MLTETKKEKGRILRTQIMEERRTSSENRQEPEIITEPKAGRIMPAFKSNSLDKMPPAAAAGHHCHL